MHTLGKRILLFTSLVALSLSTFAYAQFDPTSQLPPDDNTSEGVLIVTTNPKNPKPNTAVIVEVRAGTTDLSRATIGWLENGQLTESGKGKTRHTTVTGDAGKTTTITIVVQSVEGITYEKEVVLKPASVDLVWESQTSVPPFYKGKALYSLLGGIKVIAIPNILDDNGQKIDPKSLSYKWTNGGRVLGKQSGFGTNVLTLPTPGFRMPLSVEVEVADSTGAPVANERITVDAEQPNVLIYENSPLYGLLFNREIGSSLDLLGREMTLEAFPFFFNINSQDILSYTWRVNGDVAENFQGPSVVLRGTGGTGNASVSLQVKNPRLFTEYVSRNFGVNFGN